MDSGDIPLKLKTANIIPIHKGGNRDVPKNYRPIALTSHLIKIFEKVVRRYLVNYLEDHGLMNDGQHGFRSGRSCLSQLLAHYDTILSGLEDGGGVDVVYLDFAKAFDKVDHGITLQKLHELGVSGKVGNWIKEFLQNRTQSVIVDGVPSAEASVKSGVPQGSVIGPILFLVMMSDIDKSVKNSFVSSFADDTRVGCKIQSPEDEQKLQQDLNRIYGYADTNNMKFNDTKFELLRYRKPGEDIPPSNYIASDGNVISEKTSVRDLGVSMGNDGRFRDHINLIRDKASVVASWILRTFKSRQKKVMLTLWRSLVQPHLDYCSQLWNPALLGDIALLEQVQRSFVNRISGLEHLNYHEKLKHLGLYSLERRRERYQIIYTWRIIEHHVPNIGITTTSSERRGRSCMVPMPPRSAPKWVRDLQDMSFCVRGPRLFNCIPADIRNLTSCGVDTFKAALDTWLSTIPDEPHVSGYTAQRRAATNSLADMWRYSAASFGDRGC